MAITVISYWVDFASLFSLRVDMNCGHVDLASVLTEQHGSK